MIAAVHTCPKCRSTHVVPVSLAYHCVQCGHRWQRHVPEESLLPRRAAQQREKRV